VEALTRLRDGTVKQVSPLTGTTVWTVPGRANRPLPSAPEVREPIRPGDAERLCAFCSDRALEVTVEKSRRVVDPVPRTLHHVQASELTASVAELRRVPNLFEILGVDYWRTNHGYRVPDEVRRRAQAYLDDPAGRAHLLRVLRSRAAASGRDVDDETLLLEAVDLFAASHDVIIARRHLVDGAQYADELAGSGTLTPTEHHEYLTFTIDAMQDLYGSRRGVAYVTAFQNWLRPAGASFDHLHKQVVALDELGPQMERERLLLRDDPELFNRRVIEPALRHGLVVARNEHAVAIAGVGHRYPALEVYATGPYGAPWELPEEERRCVHDLVHAMHAAAGTHVPSNEEWHHRPPGLAEPMPWRVVLKWRVSNPAGFEGGTKIYVNTIDPWQLRARVVARLGTLREEGTVAPMDIGAECHVDRRELRYAEAGR
jgi:galactose-1-phosphate uridylyltransferase